MYQWFFETFVLWIKYGPKLGIIKFVIYEPKHHIMKGYRRPGGLYPFIQNLETRWIGMVIFNNPDLL